MNKLKVKRTQDTGQGGPGLVFISIGKPEKTSALEDGPRQKSNIREPEIPVSIIYNGSNIIN